MVPYSTRGQRNCAWMEANLFIPDGPEVGKPCRLTPHQIADTLAIFDNPHGTRTAILSYARKNAKTTYAAWLVGLCLVGPESRPNCQLYSAARDKAQAAITYNLAVKSMEQNPRLRALITPIDSKKEIHCRARGSVYKALSRDAKTKFGLSPRLLIHDELGQVEGPEDKLYSALETACMGQADPLSIIISTQAPGDNDLLSIMIDDAKLGIDPRVVLRLYTCPTSEELEAAKLPPIDEYSEEALRLANPGYDYIQNKVELLSQAAQARRMPSKRPAYKNLVLNQRCAAEAVFMDASAWRSRALGAGSIPTRRADYMGLDLSELRDLTGVAMLWEPEQQGGDLFAHAHAWLPAEGLDERSRQDKTPYKDWVATKHITALEGESLDYDLLAEEVIKLIDKFKPKKIGFDRWNWRHFEAALKRVCIKLRRASQPLLDKFVPVGMGSQTMTPALRDLEGACDPLTGTLKHSNSPVLNMCITNARTKGPTDRRMLVKKNSRSRIDCAVALAVCFAVRGTKPTAEPTKIGFI